MKKQTIYSYLQRSLVKVLIKSINSNRMKSSLAKPLKTYYASIASYARPAKKFKKLGSLVFLLAKHKHSKTLNFFRKGNTKKSLKFTCKFSLISFIKPKLAVLLSKGETLLYLTLQRKLKLSKLNHGFSNKKFFFFLPLLHGTPFYRKADNSNLLIFQAKLCPNLFVNFFVVPLSSFRFNCIYRIKILVDPVLTHVAANFGQPKNHSKAFYFTCFESFVKFRVFFNSNYNSAKLFSSSEKKWYLFQNQNKKEKEKNPKFYFYTRKPQLSSSPWPVSFGANKSDPVHQNCYKTKNKSTNYITTFHNLSDFFSLFYINTNTKISIFYYASLVRQALRTQQVLYLRQTSSVHFFFPVLLLSKTNSNYIIPLCSFQNQTIKTKKENQSPFFKVLPFLTRVLDVAIKYIKEKKEKDLYKQPILNVFFFQLFREIIEKRILSFRPCYGKVVEIGQALNSTDFFLMRPLFSLTRVDTFFICESLKLPIYPDKSNLRVDFLRNRVRKQILPAIRILLNPQFDTILCKFNELDR